MTATHSSYRDRRNRAETHERVSRPLQLPTRDHTTCGPFSWTRVPPGLTPGQAGPRIRTQCTWSPSSMSRQKTTPRPNPFCSGTLTIATHHPVLLHASLYCDPRGPRNREMPRHKACHNTHAEPRRRRPHTAMCQSVPRGLRERGTAEGVSQAPPGRSAWIFYVVTRTNVIFPSGKMRSYRLGA